MSIRAFKQSNFLSQNMRLKVRINQWQDPRDAQSSPKVTPSILRGRRGSQSIRDGITSQSKPPVLANHLEHSTTTLKPQDISQVDPKITEAENHTLDDDADSMVENLLRATDKYEAAIALQPEAAYNNKIFPIGGKCFNELVTLDKAVSGLPEILGEMELITNEELTSLPMDEDGARQLQGILFHDQDLLWCRITGWGVENSIPIVFYSPLLAENIVHDEEYASLGEIITRLRQSEIYPVIFDG
jgi:hypothetical protein